MVKQLRAPRKRSPRLQSKKKRRETLLLEKQLVKQTTCSACHKVGPSFRQCSNDHLICSHCESGEKCTLCAQVLTRNRGLERIVNSWVGSADSSSSSSSSSSSNDLKQLIAEELTCSVCFEIRTK